MERRDPIVERFKLYFPVLYYETERYLRIDDYGLTAELKDGSVIEYDDMSISFRNLPSNSRELTEQECKREFGMRLKKMLGRKGMTQSDLAEATGIQQSLLSTYMNGKTMPSLYVIDKIAKALDCSTDEFRYV